jgi:hypothetical protein
MLYSQHDPAFDRMTLGQSQLTVHGFGCYLTSIANLFQRPVTELLKVPGGITADGLVVSNVLAAYCGGSYGGASQIPGKGWCIGMTDKYASLGYPTHFICVNLDTHQQIDPLKFPAVIEPLTYPIKEYRVFGGVKLGTDTEMADLQHQLQIAQEALLNPNVSGLRKFALTFKVGRLKKLLHLA